MMEKELPHLAERKYQPKSKESDLLIACSRCLGFNRTIPIKFWDDWILEDADNMVQKYGPIVGGEKMKAKMKKSGHGILRAIWSNISKNFKGEKLWVTR